MLFNFPFVRDVRKVSNHFGNYSYVQLKNGNVSMLFLSTRGTISFQIAILMISKCLIPYILSFGKNWIFFLFFIIQIEVSRIYRKTILDSSIVCSDITIFFSNHRYLSRSVYRCYAVKQAVAVFFNHDVKWFSVALSRSKSTFRLLAIYRVALRSFQDTII